MFRAAIPSSTVGTATQIFSSFFLSVMFLCISSKSHAVHQLESKKETRLAFLYNIEIVMLDQAQELPCIPSAIQRLSDCFPRREQSAEAVPTRRPGRDRRAGIINRAKSATVHVPSGLRKRRQPISPSAIRQPRPVGFECLLLPRLSFGEALLDVDELFSSISGSSNTTPPPSCQYDLSADTRDRRTQANEYHEECVPQHPIEHARTGSESPSPLLQLQPPLHQNQDTNLLETCIRELMATPERSERRRGRARDRRVFDDGSTRPIPLLTQSSHGGYSLFPSLRQRTGNATPPALIHRPGPEHPLAKARLDSAAVPASESHQAENHKTKARLDSADLPESVINRVSTLDALEEDFSRDSAAYVPEKPASTDSSGQRNARAVPVNCSQSLIEINDTSAIKEASPPVLYQPMILPSPLSGNRSQNASRTLPLAQSLRTSRTLRCRPTTVNRPHNLPTPGIVASENPSPSKEDASAIVDGPNNSSGILAASSSSSPPVSPYDFARRGT